MKKHTKALLSWCAAALIAGFCANAISFFYRSGAGSIPRQNAYSISIRTPNSRMVRGSEGYGINYVDENGYLNDDDLPLSEHYILLMGSSHAEGLQVMQKDNMVSVLNNMIDPNCRTVYNLGTAGYTLPFIVEGFQAAIEEFPDASAVMIEISNLSCASDALIDAMDQAKYDPASSGKALMQSLNTTRQLRNDILSAVPLISLLRQQYVSMDFSLRDAFGIDQWVRARQADESNTNDAVLDQDDVIDETEAEDTAPVSAAEAADGESYYDVLNQALALLRSEFDRPIILLYHPGVSILRSGTISIDRDMRYYDDYLTACENNDIVFVDTGDAFLEAYEADFSIPYGFNNTTMQGGHLNQLGHRIIAEELYQAWMKIQDEEKS